MDDTPTPASNEPTADIDRSAALQSLADVDPADAPIPAEALAAELARDLEGVAADGEPEQLAAPFSGDEGAGP